MAVSITAIIPVKNGAATLERCLQALLDQEFGGSLEIIVLDSQSTDESKKIAGKYNAKIIDVPARTFNHGATRNLGVQHATGEFVYFTVQDAVLAGKDELQKMVAHFTDEKIMAVNGMQAVEKSAVTNPAVWFKRATQPVSKLIHFPLGSFAALTHKKQFEASAWDNVHALYRKQILQNIPFPVTNFAEDRLWARTALGQGIALVHDPSSVTYHYHHLYFQYQYKTALLLNVLYYMKFNVLPERIRIMTYLKRSYHLLRDPSLEFFSATKWIIHNWIQFFALQLAALRFYLTKIVGGDTGLKRLAKNFDLNVPQGSIK